MNQFILIKLNVSSATDAKLTGKMEIKTFIGLLCLAGRLWSNKQSLEELCVTEGEGIEKIS